MIVDGEIHLFRLETLITRIVSYRTYVAWVDGLLIDSGFRNARRHLIAALDRRSVDQVVNTHSHEDHCGNNHTVAERFGATLHAPVESLYALEHPEIECRQLYSRVVWGMPVPSRAQPLGDSIKTERFRFEVIPTPGHSRDHVCFYERERGWLFAGDLFLGVKVRVGRQYENAADHIASLRRILALEPRVFVCYHRGPIEDPTAAVRTKLAWLEEMRGQALDLSAAGVPTPVIARRLLGREPFSYKLISSGDFSKRKLVASLLRPPGQGYRDDAPRLLAAASG